jgi:hypothetical protein
MENWKNIFFLFPVMGYYLLESIVAAFFVSFAWRFVFAQPTGIYISYVQWVVGIWIIKVIFFDVFKLIAGLASMGNTNQENNQES